MDNNFCKGDRVKVDVAIDQDPDLGTKGLSSRYGHITALDLLEALVRFNDFECIIPLKYLKVIDHASTGS